jgi:membrane protein DedA with SNARE-associated domain
VLLSIGDTVTHWVESGGIVAVLLLMTAESCGIPFPSEVTMPFAGYFVAQGRLGLASVVLAGTVGNLIGSLVAYALTARWGEALLLGRVGRFVGIRRSHVEMADRWFQRRGLLAVFLGRLLPVIRTYISFPAGLARVEPLRFSALTFFGALPWCLALTLAGAALGASYDKISGPIEKVAIALAVIVAAGLVAFYVRGRHRAGEAG